MRMSKLVNTDITDMTQEDARANIGVSDDGNFLRTAILLGENSDSVDIMRNGELICRLNIRGSDVNASVDVIARDNATMRVMAWNDGSRVLNETVPNPLVCVALDNWK